MHWSEGELPEVGATREFAEEVGCEGGAVVVGEGDHVITHYSEHTRLCLHFFAKELSEDHFLALERGVTSAINWGDEVHCKDTACADSVSYANSSQ